MVRLRLTPLVALVALVAPLLSGCGGGVASIAERNRVFYAFDTASVDQRSEFETRYPPLDKKRDARDASLDYLGVTVLNGKIHLSRPADWVLRTAANEPGRRFVSYLSPRQSVFAIYEWPDRPDAPWREVIARYEAAVKEAHAEILERRVPVATWNGQGRAYVVRRKVPAAKAPYVNTSHELLVRADKRIVLVQIVHQNESIGPDSAELLRVIQTLELL